LQRRHHREQDQRRRQHDRRDQSPGEHARGVDVSTALGRGRVVAGRLDRRQQLLEPYAPGVECDRGALGREVHGRIDAVKAVELALDPYRARGAGHSVERELGALPRLGGGGRAHLRAATS
jgi:hypothetical protein